MSDEFTIDTPGGRFDISVVGSGEIDIRTPDGQVSVLPKSSNVVRVQCVPWWDDGTAAKIVAHHIENGESAEGIVAILRGRRNPNREHLEKNKKEREG